MLNPRALHEQQRQLTALIGDSAFLQKNRPVADRKGVEVVIAGSRCLKSEHVFWPVPTADTIHHNLILPCQQCAMHGLLGSPCTPWHGRRELRVSQPVDTRNVDSSMRFDRHQLCRHHRHRHVLGDFQHMRVQNQPIHYPGAGSEAGLQVSVESLQCVVLPQAACGARPPRGACALLAPGRSCTASPRTHSPGKGVEQH